MSEPGWIFDKTDMLWKLYGEQGELIFTSAALYSPEAKLAYGILRGLLSLPRANSGASHE